MIAINSNKNVMRYFPKIASKEDTRAFIARMQALYNSNGYCYFAVEIIDTGDFIGFIGLNDINYPASFSPATDIGWRLDENFWGLGYATEGANRVLKYAFERLNILKVVAIAPVINKPSIAIMKNIKMEFKSHFNHPKLGDYPEIETCVYYEKTLAL